MLTFAIYAQNYNQNIIKYESQTYHIISYFTVDVGDEIIMLVNASLNSKWGLEIWM